MQDISFFVFEKGRVFLRCQLQEPIGVQLQSAVGNWANIIKCYSKFIFSRRFKSFFAKSINHMYRLVQAVTSSDDSCKLELSSPGFQASLSFTIRCSHFQLNDNRNYIMYFKINSCTLIPFAFSFIPLYCC